MGGRGHCPQKKGTPQTSRVPPRPQSHQHQPGLPSPEQSKEQREARPASELSEPPRTRQGAGYGSVTSRRPSEGARPESGRAPEGVNSIYLCNWRTVFN